MNLALRKPTSLAEFLAWEERQELRYEFDGFQPVAMTGGTIAHDRITFNLQKALDARLAGKPCRPLGPNVKIIADGRARYPDAIAVCRPVSPTATVADDPIVVFEVLSEGSSETDLVDKNREYRATPSIQRYVVLQQTHKAAIELDRKVASNAAITGTPSFVINGYYVSGAQPLARFRRVVNLALQGK